MLTMREASLDYERGYLSGVDDYLTKTLPDAELMARIHVAFNTLSLRRTLKETRAALEAAMPIDPQSGAFTTQESLIKLTSELRRAQRYGRMLSVMTVGVHSANSSMPKAETLRAAVAVLREVVRTHVDWIGRVEGTPDSAAFAVVLPEAGPSDGPAIKARMSCALAPFSSEAVEGERLTIEFGFASLDRSSGEGKLIDAHDLLGVAEHCRKCPGQAGREQLSAVQRSVATHVAISCRHGYAVDSNCTLKSKAAPAYR